MKHIPNCITLLNLFCGCLAIISIINGNPYQAGLFVIAALIFDFLDGFVARMTRTFSPMGKELDSLADMVTFGVVPGMTLHYLFLKTEGNPDSATFIFGSYFMFLLTLFSALRLAKFNIDTRQTNHFIGVPTPAITMFIISLPLIVENDEFGLGKLILNPLVLLSVVILCSFLLVSEIPLIALKFKSWGLKENKAQYILLFLSLIAILTTSYAAAPLIIFFYIILSIIYPPGKTKAV